MIEVVRWIRPEHPSPATGATGRRGHLMRIFACLALIRTWTRDAAPSDSLAALVESALELGPPTVDDALRYLVWCRRHEPGDWPASPADRPFLTFAVPCGCAMTSLRSRIGPGRSVSTRQPGWPW